MCDSNFKNPNVQKNWLEFYALEALTRRASLSQNAPAGGIASSPPSPACGRRFYSAQISQALRFSSLHFSHTRQHLISLLPLAGEATMPEGAFYGQEATMPEGAFYGQDGSGMRVGA
jgi:hypothetical protein